MLLLRFVMLSFCGLTLLSCGPQGPARKATYPVKGMVLVDGTPPGSPILIHCHPADGQVDAKMPTISQAISDALGAFEIATYEAGDGVPPGEYTLTFTWKHFSSMSMSYSGPDKLNDRYNDPKKSPVTFTVSDQPIDLGTIELTTK